MRALLRRLLGVASAVQMDEALERLRRINATLESLVGAKTGDEGRAHEALLREIADRARGTQSSARRTDGNVQTLLRRAYLNDTQDPYQDLVRHRFRIQS